MPARLPVLLVALALLGAAFPQRFSADPPVPTFAKVAAEDWPEFRGPDGQGHATARDLPLTWSESENIAWKVPIPGLGWSSPVLQGQRLWLTTSLDQRKSLRSLCLDCNTGKMLQDVEVFAPKALGTLNPKNSNASPTPLLEPGRVYVHFGPYGTACLTTDSRILWQTTLPYTPAYGPSSSPVLWHELLIVPCDGTDVRYLVALEKDTGKVRWKTTHPDRFAESTPLVIQAVGGDQLVCNFADRAVAYDPQTGKELWWVQQGNNYAQVPRPVFGHGLVYVAGGYFSPIMQAIRPDGRGDVTKTHVAWSTTQAVPQNPSPLLAGDELYMVSDKGIASCLDATTGQLRWRERLGGDCSASPTVADGKLYFLNEEGVATVLAPGKHFRKLAVNRLSGRTLASPAFSGKALYLRTDSHLYRIEKK